MASCSPRTKSFNGFYYLLCRLQPFLTGQGRFFLMFQYFRVSLSPSSFYAKIRTPPCPVLLVLLTCSVLSTHLIVLTHGVTTKRNRFAPTVAPSHHCCLRSRNACYFFHAKQHPLPCPLTSVCCFVFRSVYKYGVGIQSICLSSSYPFVKDATKQSGRSLTSRCVLSGVLLFVFFLSWPTRNRFGGTTHTFPCSILDLRLRSSCFPTEEPMASLRLSQLVRIWLLGRVYTFDINIRSSISPLLIARGVHLL